MVERQYRATDRDGRHHTEQQRRCMESRTGLYRIIDHSRSVYGAATRTKYLFQSNKGKLIVSNIQQFISAVNRLTWFNDFNECILGHCVVIAY